jgi:hypothetical protein
MYYKIRNRIILLGLAMTIILVPTAAWAATDFQSIKKAFVRTSQDRVDSIDLITEGKIPKDGSQGFGYGVISDGPKGFKTAIVTTTHKGILDSEAQNGDVNNSVFHNHYVILGQNQICHSDPAIRSITFASPGKVSVTGSDIALSNLPKSSEDITQNSHVNDVVSFKLVIKGDRRHHSVCVTDILPAKQFFVK